jgi:hypothetical protein
MDATLRAANPFAYSTLLHPLVALLLAVLAIGSLFSKRGFVIASILIVMNFVTAAQRLYIGGMNFPIYRVVLCIGILRLIVRREFTWYRPSYLDFAVITQILVTSLAGYIRRPGSSEMIYQISTVIDACGGYMVTRMLIRDRADFRAAVRVLMWISFPIAAIFVYERVTGQNPMAVFGGVNEFTWVREGKLRVQGPYPHPILAGAYWATTVPLFLAARIRDGRRQALMYFAAIGGVVIVVLCSSSGPLIALFVGICATVLYYQRSATGRIKALAVMTLFALTIAWNKPVWFLLAKIDLTGGSTGYFRYFLVDSFVRHWKEWIVIGTRTTANWGQGMADVVNQYVSAGVNGGLLGLIAFLVSIVLSFKYVGEMIAGAADADERRDYWCLGASVLAHLFNFIGVSYFSQITLCWWMTIAFCASLRQASAQAREPLPEADSALAPELGLAP